MFSAKSLPYKDRRVSFHKPTPRDKKASPSSGIVLFEQEFVNEQMITTMEIHRFTVGPEQAIPACRYPKLDRVYRNIGGNGLFIWIEGRDSAVNQILLHRGQNVIVPPGCWHAIWNQSNEQPQIIEVISAVVDVVVSSTGKTVEWESEADSLIALGVHIINP